MILKKIAAYTKMRIALEKTKMPLAKLKKAALTLPMSTDYPFEKALAGKGLSFILEIKKASPSLGKIVRDFDYLQTAKDYQVR